MKFSNIALLSLLTASTLATTAQADNYKVYQPRITKGEFALEANLNYSADHRSAQDNYFSQVLGFEYGLTDWYKTELSGEIEKENGRSNELTNIKWENIFVPFKHGENWIDVGLYLEMEKAARDGNPNNFEAKLLLEKEFGKFDTTANFVAAHEFGPNHDNAINTGMALQAKYRLDKMFEPGIEYYADFGDSRNYPSYSEQDHKVGPVIEGKIGKVNYSTGVLFGISDMAQDTTYKLNLEYEF